MKYSIQHARISVGFLVLAPCSVVHGIGSIPRYVLMSLHNNSTVHMSCLFSCTRRQAYLARESHRMTHWWVKELVFAGALYFLGHCRKAPENGFLSDHLPHCVTRCELYSDSASGATDEINFVIHYISGPCRVWTLWCAIYMLCCLSQSRLRFCCSVLFVSFSVVQRSRVYSQSHEYTA
jgi:hypothetical protein